jgi:aminomethyltransferase
MAPEDPPPLRRTPLDTAHREAGATMVEFAGWSMPLRYRSETAEHLAVRSNAGVFDLSHMGEIEVVGADAGAAVAHAVVSDLSKLADGRAKYTMLCAPDGGVLDDLIVYRLDAFRWLVVANAANSALVVAELTERAAGFDARVVDRSDDWALVAVQGPATLRVLAPLVDRDLSTLRYYTIAPARLAGAEVLLARTGYTGEDGFEVLVRPDEARSVWDRLLGAGQEAGGPFPVAAGLAARDTLRLEAGMPLYGHELSAARTPHEAGLGRVVASEGTFVGHEALLARAATPAAERLVGLVSVGRRVPRAGYRVISPDGERPVGEVTSGAPSPTLGKPIAMAYVEASLASPGTQLGVEVRGSIEAVEVVELPFYRRPG